MKDSLEEVFMDGIGSVLYLLMIAIGIATGILLFFLPWFVYAIHKNISAIRELLEVVAEELKKK
jgi:hypothetical protein